MTDQEVKKMSTVVFLYLSTMDVDAVSESFDLPRTEVLRTIKKISRNRDGKHKREAET